MFKHRHLAVNTGDWPSGKAPGSGPDIGGSNPSSPAIKRQSFLLCFFMACGRNLIPRFCEAKVRGVRCSE